MPKPERTRKFLSHSIKLEIIRRKEKGEGNSKIGRDMGLSESTICTVYKNKEAIKAIVKTYGASDLDKRSHSKGANAAMVLMERYLVTFVMRKEKEGVPLHGWYIKEQAKLAFLYSNS